MDLESFYHIFLGCSKFKEFIIIDIAFYYYRNWGSQGLEDKVFEQEMVDKIASKIVNRRLSVPAVLFMEVLKPLSFIGAQTMNFFGPIIESLMKKDNKYYNFTEFLEKRENVERILQRIEELENQRPDEPKKRKTQKNRKSKHHTLQLED